MTIKRCYPAIIGASVGENQLWNKDAFRATATSNGVTFTNNGDGSITMNGTAESTATFIFQINAFYAITGHKYTTGFRTVTSEWYLGFDGGSFSVNVTGHGISTFTQPSGNAAYSYLRVQSGVTVNNVKVYPQLIDLTLLLGSSIAGRAYTLEQATAGSGLAWLRSYGFLSEDYKPYNAGSIESVEATAKVVRDANGENEITYPLGSDTLRGIFKLDASNNIVADGDRKEADGTITRRAKQISGNVYNLADQDTDYLWRFGLSIYDAAAVGKGTNAIDYVMSNVALDKFKWSGETDDHNTHIWPYGHNSSMELRIWVSKTQYPNYDNALAFANSIQFVYLLATPTTETSTSFTSPQIVYPDGTERFVTENGVPVGHETKYQL